MRRIGLAIHRFRPDAVALGREVARWAAENGLSAVCNESDVPVLGTPHIVAGDVSESDLLVSIGGDGTMLRAVRSLGGRPVPVVGVNVGLLGYMATVEETDLLPALSRLVSGSEGVDYTFDDRMMLDVTMWSSGAMLSTHLALNEIVIEKREAGHTARLGLDIDRASFTTYAADGLIVATPTGSTAYSLSARGPILSPRLRALLITPVSPHMLFDRSMVLDPSETVRIEVLGHRTVNVATDGDLVHTLSPGDVVEVRAATEVARLVRFEEQRFHQILKSKFGLEDR